MDNPTFRRIWGVGFFFYPICVFVLVKHVGVATVSLIMSAMLLVRLRWMRSHNESERQRSIEYLLGLGVVFGLLNVWHGEERIIRLYPVLMSSSFFLVFLHSLCVKRPFIERIARLHQKELNPGQLNYIWWLTVIWTSWLGINSVIALYTALVADIKVWVWYNNGVFYIISGLLIVVDIVYRKSGIRLWAK